MRITGRQLQRIIREAFAATAQEEAEKINAQTGTNQYGMKLATDQAFWDDMGISTGEELAVSMLRQSYSDLYKSVHGVRPRGRTFDSVDDISHAISDLEEYANELEVWKNQDAADAAFEKERTELEAARVPDPGQKAPMSQGMGRRPAAPKAQRQWESKMRVTKRQLRKIIREERVQMLKEQNSIYPNLDRSDLESELAARVGFELPDVSSWDEEQIAQMLEKLGGPKDVSEY